MTDRASASDAWGALPPPEQAAAQPVSEPPPSAPKRLASLDAFRGLTILGMLLVNNIALDEATPRQLRHAPWGGVHLADLVFPWFLLIVGVAIPFSLASHRARGLPPTAYRLRALRRALGLILLGCFLDSSIVRRPVLGLGVLQVIGLAYLVGALLAAGRPVNRGVVAALLLVGHWAALRFVTAPGSGAGVLTESENLIRHLNETFLGRYGLRGLVSLIPTSALVLIGTTVGDLLRREPLAPARRGALLLAGGMALALAGWLWSLDLPFSKPLWTAPYIALAAGLGSAVLGLLYLAVDAAGWPALAFPLVVPGANAIAAYVVPILVKVYVLQGWRWGAVTIEQALQRWCYDQVGRVAGGWLYTGAYILFWWLVLLWFYRRRILLRL